RVPRSWDGHGVRDAAAAGPDREGMGRCRRAVAREGVRGRRRSRQRRHGGRRHLHAVWHGLRLALRGLDRSRVRRVGTRLLLRPRAREPHLPVEPVPLPRPGHRLQLPDRRAVRLRRVLQPGRREDDPGARLVVADLVPSRGRRAVSWRDAVPRTGAGRPGARDRSRWHARGPRSVDAGADDRPSRRREVARRDGLMRWLRAPLVHFVAGGAVLFWLVHVRPQHRTSPIVLTAGDVDRLRVDYTRETGLEPTTADEAALVDKALQEELLFREALARGLDRNDRSLPNC